VLEGAGAAEEKAAAGKTASRSCLGGWSAAESDPFMVSKITGSALLVRVTPFVVFLALTFLQDRLGDEGRYWVYLAKTVVAGWMLYLARPFILEMRWKFSWEGCVCGVLVFAVWVGLDGLYPKSDGLTSHLPAWLQGFAGWFGLGTAKSATEAAVTVWNPNLQYGQGSLLAWFFVVVRLAGVSLVVPPLEEVFYRSFLYRYLANPDFMAVPLGLFRWMPFLVTSLVFGFGHREWLAGILCGFAYQGLVCLKGRLGDAMLAHAITNFLLGIWVIWRGAWQFW
jgi:uncharacterized protein